MENSARAIRGFGCKPWHCSLCHFRSFRRRRDVLAHIRTGHTRRNRFWEYRHKVKTGNERFRMIPPAPVGSLAVHAIVTPKPEMAFPSSVFDTKEGMTLRDYLAAEALQGMLGNSMKTGTLSDAARDAYTAADAMLEARKAVRA